MAGALYSDECLLQAPVETATGGIRSYQWWRASAWVRHYLYCRKVWLQIAVYVNLFNMRCQGKTCDARMSPHVHSCLHAHTHMHTPTHTHMRTYTCAHTLAFTHACTHTHTHTHTHMVWTLYVRWDCLWSNASKKFNIFFIALSTHHIPGLHLSQVGDVRPHILRWQLCDATGSGKPGAHNGWGVGQVTSPAAHEGWDVGQVTPPHAHNGWVVDQVTLPGAHEGWGVGEVTSSGAHSGWDVARWHHLVHTLDEVWPGDTTWCIRWMRCGQVTPLGAYDGWGVARWHHLVHTIDEDERPQKTSNHLSVFKTKMEVVHIFKNLGEPGLMWWVSLSQLQMVDL